VVIAGCCRCYLADIRNREAAIVLHDEARIVILNLLDW
jgi:hypothetical protein